VLGSASPERDAVTLVCVYFDISSSNLRCWCQIVCSRFHMTNNKYLWIVCHRFKGGAEDKSNGYQVSSTHAWTDIHVKLSISQLNMHDTKWNDIWLRKFLGRERPNSLVMQCHIPEQYPQPHCYENLRNDNTKYFSFLTFSVRKHYS
jgi:hypothetical protein